MQLTKRIIILAAVLACIGVQAEALYPTEPIRALTVLSSSRTPALTEVQTAKEQGYKHLAFNGWLGIQAPFKTPQPVIELVHTEITEAVNSPENQALYARLSMESNVLSLQAHGHESKKDMAGYGAVAKRAGMERK